MASSMFSLVVGTFIGSYFNNKTFRAEVDKSVRAIIGSGVDALNKMGGGQNAPVEPKE